jgi:competence protein ComEA
MNKIFIALLTIISLQCFAGTEANSATEAELDAIKGLGPASTALILKAREQGPFKDWKDFVKRVKGIKAAKAAQLSANGLTVASESYPIQERKE